MTQPTRYGLEIECADLGEFAALFLAECAQAIAHQLGQADIATYSLRVYARRFDEF